MQDNYYLYNLLREKEVQVRRPRYKTIKIKHKPLREVLHSIHFGHKKQNELCCS